MPKVLEDCVAALLETWRKSPQSRPKPLDPKQSVESQAWAICTAMLKRRGVLNDSEYVKALSESGDGDICGRIAMYLDAGFGDDDATAMALADRDAGRSKTEGLGAALKGVALTIIPFIKRQETASIVNNGDTKLMRIPLMRKGRWRHPTYGILEFNDTFFDQISKNFNDGVIGQMVPVKDGHTPHEQHALGWVTSLQMEGENRDRLIVYAEPCDERGIEIIQKRKAPYASAEFVFNYRDSELRTLSLSDCVEADVDDNDGDYKFSEYELDYIEKNLECACDKEDNMPSTTDKGIVLSEQEWDNVQAALRDVAELRGHLASLEAALADREARIVELEVANESAWVAALMERARNYRDAEGKAHSPIFLNALEAALMCDELKGADGTVVKLSEEVTVESVRNYFRNVLRYLAENMPGVVPTVTHVEALESRDVKSNNELSEEEAAGSKLWEEVA